MRVWSAVLVVAGLVALGGCSSDDPTEAKYSYVNGRRNLEQEQNNVVEACTGKVETVAVHWRDYDGNSETNVYYCEDLP